MPRKKKEITQTDISNPDGYKVKKCILRDVAAAYGLGMGEEFKLLGVTQTLRFSEVEGIEADYGTLGWKWLPAGAGYLQDIILGKRTVYKVNREANHESGAVE